MNTIGIDLESFKNMYCFFAVDLSGDFDCNGKEIHVHSERRGILNVEIVFDTAPTTPLQLVSYGTFHKNLFIDAERSVEMDY